MTFSFEHLVLFGDALVLPAAAAAALPLYSRWWRDMRGSRAIQIVALVIIAAAATLDGIDRIGLLWPAPSQVQASAEAAWKKVAEQAVLIDRLKDQLKAAERPKAPKNGPVSVITPKDCPPGYTVLMDSELAYGAKGNLSMPKSARICIVRTKMHDAPVNVEIRSK